MVGGAPEALNSDKVMVFVRFLVMFLVRVLVVFLVMLMVMFLVIVNGHGYIQIHDDSNGHNAGTTTAVRGSVSSDP